MPIKSDVYTNAALTNISVATIQEDMSFIAPQVFPIVPVMKDSGIYYTFDAGDLLRDDMNNRAPSTRSAGMDYDLTSSTYSCQRYALHQAIDIEIKDNQENEVASDATVAKILTQKALIRFERMFAANYFAASKWTGSSTGSDITASIKWDASGSAPVSDVELQKRYIQGKCGYAPNVMVVTAAVHSALKSNADVLARLSANERGIGTEEQMAAIFGVNKYLVANNVYNSAQKGATTALTNIFGTEGALLVYAAPTPSLLVPSAGYIFASKQRATNNWGLTVRNWYQPEITSDIIEVEFKLDAKLVYANAGAYFADVLS